MHDLLKRISLTAGCLVRPPVGLPDLPEPYVLPGDLHLFYTLCGGVVLFENSAYGIEVVQPERFLRANPIIVGEDGADDLSYHWFIVGEWEEQRVTIDLAPSKLGCCYDSFWDRHAYPGNCPVIARSFTGFLLSSLANRGGHSYWLEEHFPSLGDAYDA